uniref:Immunoglobulin C1-set domain-containing protein n=1 Tax=Astyanax mexicanus TaxID=7994 RepID=A0A3B1JPJ2_ASTMX
LKAKLKYCSIFFLFSAPPAVHIFANKSVNHPNKLNLTCLITGFYPKDVKMSLRKFGTEIPEHLITSSGRRELKGLKILNSCDYCLLRKALISKNNQL